LEPTRYDKILQEIRQNSSKITDERRRQAEQQGRVPERDCYLTSLDWVKLVRRAVEHAWRRDRAEFDRRMREAAAICIAALETEWFWESGG
jgi:hypothetical protein